MSIDYKNFKPAKTTRVREDIEWSMTRSYNSLDTESPRIMMIGDSICNGYHDFVRSNLADKANISFWATSKCVTDPDFFRELDFVLDSGRFDMVSFNNGAHSPFTNVEEWDEHFTQTVKFIQAKLPHAKLLLITTTPGQDDTRNIQMRRLNETVHGVAKSESLPLLDFYAAMDPVKDKALSDRFHYHEEYKEIQAKMISDKACELLELKTIDLTQKSTETGPAGSLK